MITCVEVGDICNHGANYLVTLSAEGWCHVFSVRPDTSLLSSQDLPDATGSASDNDRLLKPIYKDRLAENCKVFLIADIDGDGMNELIIGYTDRMVRAYRWTPDNVPQSATNPMSTTAPEKQCPTQCPCLPCVSTGCFVIIDKWLLAGQIGSMSVNKRSDGQTTIMVSQPGGSFVTLVCSKTPRRDLLAEDALVAEDLSRETPLLVYHPLGSARARNPAVTTEVVGSISRQKKGKETLVPNYSAICTLDGTLTLVDDDKILWSLYVDHQLFSLNKLDVTGDGTEEVVACSWDGQTYLVNLSKEVVRFHFRENVAAFCAGLYTFDKTSVPCLFYATFNNKIVAYYNLQMSEIGTTNLVSTVWKQPSETHSQLLKLFNCDATRPDHLRLLHQWCLYGLPLKGDLFESSLASTMPHDDINSSAAL